VTCPYTYLNDDPVTFAATVAADTNYVTANASIRRSVRALVPTIVVTAPGRLGRRKGRHQDCRHG
jgi:hypothetical protein